MKLADTDIKARLTTLSDIGITQSPTEVMKLIKDGHIPNLLNTALAAGKIIVDPLPVLESRNNESGALGSSTLDLELGVTFEVLSVPYEVVRIDDERVIRPFVVDCDPGHSRRLSLQETFGVTIIDQSWIRFTMEENDVFELSVGSQVNAFTRQIICLPHDLEGNIDGRSRLARKGITTHITSSRFDAGFCGFVTVEILNTSRCPFNLRPGPRICSIGFVQLSKPVEVPYYKKAGARFSGQH